MIDHIEYGKLLACIGSEWKPKNRPNDVPWKVTDAALSHYGLWIVQLTKYQGGRNSPALMTTKKLMQNFTRL